MLVLATPNFFGNRPFFITAGVSRFAIKKLCCRHQRHGCSCRGCGWSCRATALLVIAAPCLFCKRPSPSTCPAIIRWGSCHPHLRPWAIGLLRCHRCHQACRCRTHSLATMTFLQATPPFFTSGPTSPPKRVAYIAFVHWERTCHYLNSCRCHNYVLCR